MRSNRTYLVIALLAGAVACRKSEPPKPSAETPAAAPESSAASVSSGMMAPGHAPAAPAAAPALASVTGTITETMDSGGYTYMKLQTAGGSEEWTAVNQAKVKKGQTVTVVNAMPMDGFESKTLKRKFDKIVFGQLESEAASGHAGTSPAAVPPGGPREPSADVRSQMAAQHAGLAQPADVGKIDVPKAEGKDAKRVAELFAEKAQLDGKSVTVRGKVVKFTPGVMGRNWIHLRDGSGTSEKKDNDITVTSKDGAAVGDVVVVKGKVGVGRDFGMGYSYPVLIEEALVAK